MSHIHRFRGSKQTMIKTYHCKLVPPRLAWRARGIGGEGMSINNESHLI